MVEAQESPPFVFYKLTLKNYTIPTIQCRIEFEVLVSTLYSRSEDILK